MIDHALGILRTRLTDEDVDLDLYVVEIEDDPQSPWILFDFNLKPPSFVHNPRNYSYALWKGTGDVHDVIEGAVQDPPIFTL